MPSFSLSARADAPVEEVWKLLHDPTRFPDWWAGIADVRTGSAGEYTMWPTGYPDYPMAQRLGTNRTAGRVTISCLVSDLEFIWQLREDGDGTSIEVRAELPDAEAHRLDTQRALLTESLARLSQLAMRRVSGAPPC